MSAQPLEFSDFSGGVTDYFVGAPLNRYEEADNLLIFKYGDDRRGQVGRLFTRPGSEIRDDTYYQIPAGAQRIGTLRFFENTLLSHSARKFYYVSSGWVTLQGPSSNDVFPSGTTTSHYVSLAEGDHHLLITNDNFHKVQKIYPNASSVLTLRTAGMPALASSPTCTPGAGANTYIYRFHYEYTYTVGTVVYVDRGPTTQVTVASAEAPNVNDINITAIPAIANSTVHNYDTASSDLKVKIARTINGGQVFYYAGSVANGTTTFNDSMSDATLQLQTELYTEDGSVERNEPPLCKYIHIVEQKSYFAHVKDGSEVISTRIYQSVPGELDSVGEDFYCDVDHEIRGISSHRGLPIVGCTKGAYRIEGAFDVFGRGGMIAKEISSTASCVSHQSMVKTPYGVFWAGTDGFYYSDGYNCFRINEGWDKTYQDIVSTAVKKLRIYGKFDPKKNRIYWACSKDAEVTDNNAIWVLSLDWGVSPNMPFTSYSGGSGTSFAPTALEVDESGNLIRADKRGYIFDHSDTLYVDPRVDTTVAPSSWVTETIIYNFKSAATNFGTSYERKWVTGVNVSAENETNLSLQIISNNDKGRKRANLSPIRFRGNWIWGDDDIVWGDPGLIWNYSGLISEKRRMPAGHLRCDYKQIELTNAKVALYNSDTFGTVSVNSSTKVATLNVSANDFPASVVDYFISFEVDGYDKEYRITARTSDTVTYSDSGNTTVTAGASGFVIRGYPRNEVLFLISFAVHYEIFGKTQDVFKNSQSGEVGSDS